MFYLKNYIIGYLIISIVADLLLIDWFNNHYSFTLLKIVGLP